MACLPKGLEALDVKRLRFKMLQQNIVFDNVTSGNEVSLVEKVLGKSHDQEFRLVGRFNKYPTQETLCNFI